MQKTFKVAQVRDLLNQVYNEKITFSRFVEILNEHAEGKMKADREAVQNGGKSYICINCKRSNIFKRKPYKPVSDNIAGYCKHCGHVVWCD